MISDNDLIGAAMIITKFEFQGDFDIADLIMRILENKNLNAQAAKSLVIGKVELEKLYVNILVSLKNIKGATRAVKDFKLSPDDFPILVEQASFNAANYFVSQCFRSPSHPDHLPLHKVEDLFSNEPVLIHCLCTLLFKRWVKNHKANKQDKFLQKIIGVMKR